MMTLGMLSGRQEPSALGNSPERFPFVDAHWFSFEFNRHRHFDGLIHENLKEIQMNQTPIQRTDLSFLEKARRVVVPLSPRILRSKRVAPGLLDGFLKIVNINGDFDGL